MVDLSAVVVSISRCQGKSQGYVNIVRVFCLTCAVHVLDSCVWTVDGWMGFGSDYDTHAVVLLSDSAS